MILASKTYSNYHCIEKASGVLSGSQGTCVVAATDKGVVFWVGVCANKRTLESSTINHNHQYFALRTRFKENTTYLSRLLRVTHLRTARHHLSNHPPIALHQFARTPTAIHCPHTVSRPLYRLWATSEEAGALRWTQALLVLFHSHHPVPATPLLPPNLQLPAPATMKSLTT